MTVLDRLAGKLVVSCQAQTGSPLNTPEAIAAIAAATVKRGAAGVRIEGPERVRAVRDRLPDTPLIGLWKQQVEGFAPYITPQYHHAEAIARAGVDIVAIDATARPRPNSEAVADIVQQVHDNFGVLVMADIDSMASAKFAIAAGVDLIGTTLFGYTDETQTQSPPGFDLLADLIAWRDRTGISVPIVCEGGISSPEQMAQALTIGADSVVVGTAITGIDLLVDRYIRALV